MARLFRVQSFASAVSLHDTATAPLNQAKSIKSKVGRRKIDERDKLLVDYIIDQLKIACLITTRPMEEKEGSSSSDDETFMPELDGTYTQLTQLVRSCVEAHSPDLPVEVRTARALYLLVEKEQETKSATTRIYLESMFSDVALTEESADMVAQEIRRLCKEESTSKRDFKNKVSSCVFLLLEVRTKFSLMVLASKSNLLYLTTWRPVTERTAFCVILDGEIGTSRLLSPSCPSEPDEDGLVLPQQCAIKLVEYLARIANDWMLRFLPREELGREDDAYLTGESEQDRRHKWILRRMTMLAIAPLQHHEIWVKIGKTIGMLHEQLSYTHRFNHNGLPLLNCLEPRPLPEDNTIDPQSATRLRMRFTLRLVLCEMIQHAQTQRIWRDIKVPATQGYTIVMVLFVTTVTGQLRLFAREVSQMRGRAVINGKMSARFKCVFDLEDDLEEAVSEPGAAPLGIFGGRHRAFYNASNAMTENSVIENTIPYDEESEEDLSEFKAAALQNAASAVRTTFIRGIGAGFLVYANGYDSKWIAGAE
jgi:hypothetical protein